MAEKPLKRHFSANFKFLQFFGPKFDIAKQIFA